MAKGKRKIFIRALITAAVIIVLLLFLQRLLMPKYAGDVLEGDVVEGGMIDDYYDSDMDHDVVFIGDCEVYENISTAVLWEEYGINSYIRGSAQQLIWQSYYLAEETLTYETPDVIVFNVLSMQYDEPQKETYNRMTLDGMRWSSSKVGSILASMTSEESFIEYVFPILRYHSRWSELTSDDLTYFFGTPSYTFNGYYMRVDVEAAEDVPEGRVLGDYTFGDTAYEYLEKLTQLCEESGVELVLIKAPSLYPEWYDEWDEQIETYAAEHGLKYYNFLEMQEEIGLDWSQDTYDAGLHLNLSGAEKLAAFFGEILTEECGLESRRGEEALEEEWEEILEAYDAEAARQYAVLEEE